MSERKLSRFDEGVERAKAGGGLRDNPYIGGTPDWWDWTKGYKFQKQMDADFARKQSRRA